MQLGREDFVILVFVYGLNLCIACIVCINLDATERALTDETRAVRATVIIVLELRHTFSGPLLPIPSLSCHSVHDHQIQEIADN